MRPEPKLGCAPVFVLLIVLSIWYGVSYFENIKPHNDHIKNETKKILDNAREESINSLDTLDLRTFLVNTESARKDSACLAKEMHNWMKQQGENPRFCDYKYVYDSVGTKNGQTVFRLSKHMWRVNIDKAMKDQEFAKTFSKYCETIKQLEIARRKQNQK